MANRLQASIPRDTRRLRIAAAVLAAVLCPAPALAADAVEDDPYNLSLGAYFVTRTNGSIRLDRSLGRGFNRNEHRLGAGPGRRDHHDGPAHRRLLPLCPQAPRGLQLVQDRARRQIVTQRGIDFGNVPSFPAGTPIDSQFNTETTKLVYTYSFYRTPEIETSLSAGLHVTNLDVSLKSAGLGIAESNSATAPLPVFGFRLDYAITPKWWMRGKYELFFLDSVQTYTGALSDFTISIEHRTFQHLGFGFGLNRSSLDLEVDDGTKKRRVQLGAQRPHAVRRIALSAGFQGSL